MSVFRRMVCALFILATAAACSSSGQKADPAVERDFAKYKAQMVTILPIEQRAIDANTQASEAAGANDATYAKELREKIIPTFQEFWAELIRMRPLTEPVLELHRLYVRRIALLIAGFTELEKAARKGDKALIASFQAKAAEAKALMNAWNAKIAEMNEQYK